MRPLLVPTALALVSFAVASRPVGATEAGVAAAASEVVVSLDEGAAASLLGGSAPAGRLLEAALRVEGGGGWDGGLVLVAYRLRNGYVVGSFASAPFEVGGDGPARVPALPAAGFYAGATVAAGGVAASGPGLPAASAVADPARYVLDWTAEKPPEWKVRDAFYVVAVPADPAARSRALARPLVFFGEGAALRTAFPRGEPTTAAEVMERAAAWEAARNLWVLDYTVYQNVQGFEVPMYYERTRRQLPEERPAGGAELGVVEPVDEAEAERPAYRLVPPTEYQERWYEEAGVPAPAFTEGFAAGLDLVGQAHAANVPGLGAGLQRMTSFMSTFVRAGAEADGSLPYTSSVADEALFAERARIVGREPVGGRDAFHLRADALSDVPLPSGDGAEYTMRAASVWVDAQNFVPLRLDLEVEAWQGGEARAFTVRRENRDWARFGTPFGALMEREQALSIGGLAEAMGEEERREMESARARMAEARAQLERLPESARAAVQQQIAQLERMTAGGGESLFEAVVANRYVAVNEGPPYPGGIGDFVVGDAVLRDAMVIAEWRDLCDLVTGSCERGNLFLPVGLGFRGRIRSTDGSRSADAWADLEYDLMDTATARSTILRGGDRYGPYAFYVSGVLRAGRSGKDTVDEVPFIMGMQVGSTRAYGYYESDLGWGRFAVGHMPCSAAPRGLDASDLRRLRAGAEDPARDDAFDMTDELAEQAQEWAEATGAGGCPPTYPVR